VPIKTRLSVHGTIICSHYSGPIFSSFIDWDQFLEPNPGLNRYSQMALVVVYIIIALIALTMNLFIITVIFKNKLHNKVSPVHRLMVSITYNIGGSTMLKLKCHF